MKQTVTSKYEPKSKNVTWIDMSSGSPVLKNYINGRWMPTGGSGGGASSSNPTEADATKVWQVTPVQKGTKTEETVIVPEQTLIDGQELEYNEKFVPGAQCVAVINGVEYRGEVVIDEEFYVFAAGAELYSFGYQPNAEIFAFFNDVDPEAEATAKLSVIEEVPDYDYNWAPGVKIPIPTAEDEGKILIVTKVEGDNTSIIVPEQEVPEDDSIPLTDVDLTKFVVGNAVKVTVSANSETFTATGVIEEHEGITSVVFSTNDFYFSVWKENNSLYIGANFGPNSTIKLEYIESNYEYQLQENSGGSGSTSNILWPAMYEYDGNEIMATFVPEDIEPNTWCMVCGVIYGSSIDTCLPVLITSSDNYVICTAEDSNIVIDKYTVEDGSLLRLNYENK